AVVEALRPWALTQVLQPLDRPDDAEFRMAVAALHTAEGSTEFSQTELPAVDDGDAVLPVAKAPDLAATVMRPADAAPFPGRRAGRAELHSPPSLGAVTPAVLLGGLLLPCLPAAFFCHCPEGPAAPPFTQPLVRPGRSRARKRTRGAGGAE